MGAVKVTSKDKEGSVSIAIEGDIDQDNVEKLVGAFEAAAASAETTIHLDFSRVTYIDSMGIRALYGLAARLDGQGAIRVTGLSPDLQRIFRICGLLAHERLRVEGTGKRRATVARDGQSSRLQEEAGPWARSFPSRFDQLGPVRAFIQEVAARAGFDDARTFDLKVAVSEAAANAVEHGSEGGDLSISAVLGADRLTVSVTHDGDFRPRLPGDPTRSHRGMGFPLMLALTDEVTVCRHPSGETSVSLSFLLDR